MKKFTFILLSLMSPLIFAQQSNQSGTNFNSVTNFAENSGNTVSNVSQSTASQVKTVPSVSAPSIVSSGSDSCLVGVSGSANVLGLGVSAGTSLRDVSCERLKHSARLQALGYTDASLLVLVAQSENEEALKIGNPDVFKKIVGAKLSYAKARQLALSKRGMSSMQLDESILQLEIELEIASNR